MTSFCLVVYAKNTHIPIHNDKGRKTHLIENNSNTSSHNKISARTFHQKEDISHTGSLFYIFCPSLSLSLSLFFVCVNHLFPSRPVYDHVDEKQRNPEWHINFLPLVPSTHSLGLMKPPQLH